EKLLIEAPVNGGRNYNGPKAEVYWGDLARGDNGQIRWLISLFQLIMGMGHIVRENIRQVHGSDAARPGGHWSAYGAMIFVRLLHGPITALNLVFAGALAGIVLLEMMGLGTHDFGHAGTVALGIVAAAMGFAARFGPGPEDSTLKRMFWRGQGFMAAGLAVLIAGTMLILPLISDPATHQLLGALTFMDMGRCPDGVINAKDECLTFWYAGSLITATGATWTLSVLIVLALGGAQIFRGLRRPKTRELALYPAACGLMLVLWMFVAVVVWVSAAGTLVAVVPSFDNDFRITVDQAIALAVWVWGALILLVISLVATLGVRLAWKRRTKGSVAGSASDPVPRMVVSMVVRWTLVASVLVLLVGALLIGLRQFADPVLSLVLGPEGYTQLRWTPVRNWPFWEFHDTLFKHSILAAAGVAALAVALRDQFAAGLGIAKDIVIWFVNRADATAPTYPLRARILVRFSTVHRNLIGSGTYDAVLVVSHSQGTLVAFEALRQGRSRGAGGPEPALVTMGSPVWHLYGTYFPADYTISDADQVGIGPWRNIYRTDDFVGTEVQGLKAWPENRAVDAAGHIGYWTDDAVRDQIVPDFLPEFAATKTNATPVGAGTPGSIERGSKGGAAA
ncbi:MAG: hypothetical protein AAF631_09390, partial [Pseudomonadota bacterium]